MTERSIVHATFTIERVYDAAPSRVFQACTDPQLKRRWFIGPDEPGGDDYRLDFRLGGREFSKGQAPDNGPVYTYENLFWDIVPNERVVSTYEMLMDGQRISVSLATQEFKPSGSGTRLVYTEMGGFLDGLDDPKLREQGIRAQLENLAAELARTPA